jgi:hypothetical protein
MSVVETPLLNSSRSNQSIRILTKDCRVGSSTRGHLIKQHLLETSSRSQRNTIKIKLSNQLTSSSDISPRGRLIRGALRGPVLTQGLSWKQQTNDVFQHSIRAHGENSAKPRPQLVLQINLWEMEGCSVVVITPAPYPRRSDFEL